METKEWSEYKKGPNCIITDVCVAGGPGAFARGPAVALPLPKGSWGQGTRDGLPDGRISARRDEGEGEIEKKETIRLRYKEWSGRWI